jgi:primosomal protein DnaI
MAAALGNYLTAMGVDSFMVYVPAFAQEIYASFKNNTTSDLVGAVKNVKVLIFDDIGAENLNPYLRDDVLGNILQHRMSEHLPTIFTSNLSMDELEQHMGYTPKGGGESLKARRIMERIRHFATPLEIRGKNRRLGAV